MAPWSAEPPARAFDVLQADSVLQFYGWRDLVFESWRNGVPPYWNPYVLGGTPLLANSQSGGFYPPHILVGLLRLPTESGIDLLAWFHLFIAGWGVFALSRRLGADNLGAVAAGTGFQLTPFMLSWTPLASVTSTVAWIPWLLTGIVALIGFGDDDESLAVRARASLALGMGASAAMMMLAGHLQFVAYGFLAAFVTAVVGFAVLRPKSIPQRAGWVVAGLALGGCLAAPQLMPVLDYAQYSHRRNAPSAEGYAAYNGLALPPVQVIARLSNPFAEGNPLAQSENVPTHFLPAILKPGANFAESAITVGPLLLIGALMALRRATQKSALVMGVLGSVALLMATGSEFNRLLYFGVPGWSSTGSPGRAQVLALLAICVLAGVGLSQRGSVKEFKVPLAVGGLLALLGIALAGRTLPLPQGLEGLGSVAQGDALVPGALGVLLAGLVLGILFAKPQARAALAAGPAVLAILCGTLSLVRTGDPSFLADASAGPAIGPYERVAAVNDPWGFVGIAPALYPPNTLVPARIHDLGGYDSLLHRDTIAMLNDVNGQDTFPPANGNMAFIKPTADRAKLAEAGVSKLIRHVPGGLQVEELGGTRVSVDEGTAEITRQDAQSMTVQVNGGGFVTLKDRRMPGWRAVVNGMPTRIRGDVWRRIQVPNGTSTVELTYRPPGLERGIQLGILGAVAALLLAGLTIREGRVWRS